MSATPKNIVVVGGGIIGATTAFYLADHPDVSSATITVIEASVHGAAQGASGKAGGLVAKWAYPKALTAISFPEHVKLAERFDGTKRWGWRWVGTGEWEGRGIKASAQRVKPGAGPTTSLGKKGGIPAPTHGVAAAGQAKGLPEDLTWVSDELTDTYTPMASPGDTAQVHPYLFTTSMLDLAVARGVRFLQGRVFSLDVASGQVQGVRYAKTGDTEELHLPADYIVLAAGAWSPALLPSLPVSGTRAHSVVIRAPPSLPAHAVSPYVLFTSITLPAAGRGRPRTVTPEIYPRPDSTIYVCGPGDHRVPLPPTVDDVSVDPHACEEIWQWVAETGIIQDWALGDIEQRQACYLPVVDGDGGPIVGEVPAIKGLIVATGHTCWGICNAPGTAKAVSELIFKGNIECADLTGLDPAKFL
ncbi:FAD dependent oxidoreductase [Artomyces pyxidatus]|uniref:FAD dependent oxidoreductase n=1 Tax=Artomyces pyxidatus TaxID=48021 RepID=A0ACB8SV50_9AGAM|nr:FAD dependent oxidoreductase [Artomyces pyxidatus]